MRWLEGGIVAVAALVGAFTILWREPIEPALPDATAGVSAGTDRYYGKSKNATSVPWRLRPPRAVPNATAARARAAAWALPSGEPSYGSGASPLPVPIASEECLRPGRTMQLVLVSDHIAPGLCPAVAAAFRLNWTVHVIGFRGAKASALADGKKGRNGKPELIGAALDSPAFAAALGDDAILLLDAYDAYVQLGPARALAAYCALQRDAQVEVEERARARFAGERLVASTEATLFPFKHGATNIRSRWRERFPPAPDEIFSAVNIGGLAGDAAAFRFWRDAHAALRGGAREQPRSGLKIERIAAGEREFARKTNDQGAFLVLALASDLFRARLARDTGARLFLSVPKSGAAARAHSGGPPRQLSDGTVVLGKPGARARAPTVLHWPGAQKDPSDRTQSTDYAGALACGHAWGVYEGRRKAIFTNVTAAALGARVTAWRADRPGERDASLAPAMLERGAERCFVRDSKRCRVEPKGKEKQKLVSCVRWAFQLPKKQCEFAPD